MPYASRRQQRWAHATHQPFARRWDKETPDFAALPEKKDAGAEAGAPLHGPGGLLGTPGIRSQRRARRAVSVTTKPMSRSEAARVAALARWGKYTPHRTAPSKLHGAAVAPLKVAAIKPLKAPKGGKGKKGRTGAKPKPTEAERAAAQQAKRDQRDREREQAREAARQQVYEKMGIAPDGREALEALRRGEQPDPAAIARGGFVDAGLVERAADGSYRMTPAGRALMSSAESGDAGRAGDTISGSRDRLSQRRARQAEQAKQRQEAQAKRTQGSGGAKKQPPKPKPMSAAQRRRLQRAQQRIADTVQRVRERRTTKAQTAEDRAMFAKMGGGGKGGTAGSGGGSKLWARDPKTGKRTPTDEQRDAQQQRQVRQLAVSDQQREAHARRAGDKAERETRERYRIESTGDGEYALRDYNRATSAYRGVSVASGNREKVDRALNSKVRAARTRAENDARQSVDFYNSDVRRGMYPNPSSAKRDREKFKSFTVYKDHTGAHRWLARTTTAYRDRDREILSTDALDRDSQRMTATKQFGPLRWWHVGLPDPLDVAQPWGPGLDIGDCDFSMQIGRTRVESGTFKNEAIARRIAATADQYELSPGFFHPVDEPAPDGVFTQIRTFERSLVPTRYGRASNLFTGLTVKETRMTPQEQERRFKAMVAELQLTPEQAAVLAAGITQSDKSAQAQGIAFKSDDAPPVFTAPDGTQGLIVDGHFVALKAAMPEMVDDEEKADGGDQEGAPVDEMAEMMDDQAFIGAIADAVVAKIAPMFGDMKMSEFKTLLGGMAAKEAGTQARIQALEAELARLKGDQPALTAAAEIDAALKSQGPQAPPDPTQVQIPADATPVQRLAMQTMPALYQNTPQGAFQGWLPPTQLPPQPS